VLHQAIFGQTPREDWLRVDEALAAELRERLARLGYEGELDDAFNQWAGTENLEERVDGVDEIDPVVLEELRSRT
jgi:aminopeptidase N